MKKMTIHEKREHAIYLLAKRSDNYDSDTAVYNKARYAMDCFYRLAGMDERLLYLTNDEYWHDKRMTKDLENKAEKSLAHVKELLKEFNADIAYFEYLPSIIDIKKTEGGGCYPLNLEYFYQR